ncbi:GNAT family N-acetyltransferase [Caedibacter taeniospiralis]|uniref:GNAT family N-acetyltransferase n=1 Tax=Caedibacter taeniospiralis TaxID=28907 RepID=UPI0037BE5C42
MPEIHFEKASVTHVDIIFDWLSEPFIQEFWDNTQGHKDDILSFVNGRREPSNYCDGKYVYWIAICNAHPFAMLMTIQETAEDHEGGIKLNHLSKTGNTYGIDYMIGDKYYFGKGYGAKTLSEFLDFFRREFDVSADTFIIDPAADNPRAKHVYMKAGFEHIADFVMDGDCSGSGKLHHLLIKKIEPIILAIGDLNGVQLTGEKLLLETLSMEYAEDICKNFTAKITRWMWPSTPKTQAEINQHILEQQQAMSKGEELALLVLKKESQEFVGYIAIHALNTATPEMGIWLKEEAQGQGYGFEALSLLKDWAEENLSFNYLKYPVEKNNFASRALAEKLGGKVEAEYIKKSESGQILDEVEYRFYKTGTIKMDKLKVNSIKGDEVGL